MARKKARQDRRDLKKLDREIARERDDMIWEDDANVNFSDFS